MSELDGFYAGRRVFVTGHTGFKGSWLSLWLASLGARVTGLSLKPSTKPHLFGLAGVAGLVESRFGDIRDTDRLAALLKRSKAEVLFHLAAQPLVRRSYAEPGETFSVNVQGTASVLEAALRSSSVRAIVVVTTDKVYADLSRPCKETDALGGHDPYSASKAAAELVAASYYQSFFAGRGVGLATARAGNVIGGGDWAEDRLIPDCARALAARRAVTLRNPRSVRPWQHALEPLAGYLVLAARLRRDPKGFSEPWNFGPAISDAPAVETVARLFLRASGAAASRLKVDRSGRHPHEAPALRLDASKAKRRLGWKPVWRSERAVMETALWYRAHRERRPFDAAGLCLAQIAAYSRDAR